MPRLMGMPQKILSIWLLLGALLWATAEQNPLSLTPAEQAWIRTHPIITAQNEMDWPPYNFSYHGDPMGFSIDYLRLLASKLHLKVRYRTGKPWYEYLQLFRQGKLDLLLNIRKTKERERYILFTPSYVSAGKSIFTNLPGIYNLSNLEGKTVAIPRGYYIEEFLRTYYPGIRLLLQPTLLQSIVAVAEKKADAVVGDYNTISELMQDKGIKLRYAAMVEDPRLDGQMRIGVSPKKPMLREILSKAMRALTPQEIRQLKSRWLDSKRIDPKKALPPVFDANESAYLHAHPTIRMCNNPNWVPIEFAKEGNMSRMAGIAIDILHDVGHRLHLQFKNVPTRSWSESQRYLKEGKCDILPAAVRTKKREAYARFTRPYLTYRLAIITRKDRPFIRGLEDLQGKVFARKKGSGLISKMRRRFPGIKILETPSYLDSFRAVSSGKAYYTLATLPVAAYFINRYQLNDLSIAGYTEMKYPLSIAVRKDMAPLVPILDKALAEITPQEKRKIFDRWTNVHLEEMGLKIDPRILWSVGLGAGFLILLALMRYWHMRRSMQETRELLDSAMEGIVLHRNGRCVDLNESMIKMLGFPDRKSAIDANVFDWVAPEYRSQTRLRAKSDYDNPYEVQLLRQDGSRFYALIHGKFIRKGALRLVSAVDITQLKEQEKIISQQSKLAALGEMIGNIAHQWRQPLSVISSIATGVKMKKRYGLLEDEEFYRSCDDVNHQVQYLSQTIDDFRNFIKGTREDERFSLKEEIDEMLELVKESIRTHDITVETEIPDSIVIHGYKNELIQCLLNLYTNAKDALEILRPEPKLIRISAEIDAETLRIRFLDNAGGIPEEIGPKIFDPYFTTKHQAQGTGLGLYMTHKLITEGMGGQISASNSSFSYQGKVFTGALFTITLPVHPPAKEKAKRDSSSESNEKGEKK
ncbi:transporter substrate-binding domain-containing protein [Nitratifractor sp.]